MCGLMITCYLANLQNDVKQCLMLPCKHAEWHQTTFDVVSKTFEAVQTAFDVVSKTFEAVQTAFDVVSKTFEAVQTAFNYNMNINKCITI